MCLSYQSHFRYQKLAQSGLFKDHKAEEYCTSGTADTTSLIASYADNLYVRFYLPFCEATKSLCPLRHDAFNNAKIVCCNHLSMPLQRRVVVHASEGAKHSIEVDLNSSATGS